MVCRPAAQVTSFIYLEEVEGGQARRAPVGARIGQARHTQLSKLAPSPDEEERWVERDARVVLAIYRRPVIGEAKYIEEARRKYLPFFDGEALRPSTAAFGKVRQRIDEPNRFRVVEGITRKEIVITGKAVIDLCHPEVLARRLAAREDEFRPPVAEVAPVGQGPEIEAGLDRIGYSPP